MRKTQVKTGARLWTYVTRWRRVALAPRIASGPWWGDSTQRTQGLCCRPSQWVLASFSTVSKITLLYKRIDAFWKNSVIRIMFPFPFFQTILMCHPYCSLLAPVVHDRPVDYLLRVFSLHWHFLMCISFCYFLIKLIVDFLYPHFLFTSFSLLREQKGSWNREGRVRKKGERGDERKWERRKRE